MKSMLADVVNIFQGNLLIPKCANAWWSARYGPRGLREPIYET